MPQLPAARFLLLANQDAHEVKSLRVMQAEALVSSVFDLLPPADSLISEFCLPVVHVDHGPSSHFTKAALTLPAEGDSAVGRDGPASSIVERFLQPFVRVESHKSVVWLHLDPAHLVAYVHPAFRLEELGGG